MDDEEGTSPHGWMTLGAEGQSQDERRKTKKRTRRSVRSIITGLEASTMFRVRAASFLTGFAAASGIAMYQLQRDVWGSHHILSDEVTYYTSHVFPIRTQIAHHSSRALGFQVSIDSSIVSEEVGGHGKGTESFGG